MRKSILATALAGILVWAGVATAAPLSPGFGVGIGGGAATAGGSTAGEGAAPNTCIVPGPGSTCGPTPPTAVQHLDWIVTNDGNPNGGFTYYYQLENSSVATATNLNIASANFVAVGFIPGVDLDAGIPAGAIKLQTPPAGAAIAPNPSGVAVAGHRGTVVTANNPVAGLYANLDITDAAGGEHESCGATCAPATPDLICCSGPLAVLILPGQSTSFFVDMFPGRESGVIVGQGLAPVYVNWNTSGGPNTWNNQASNPAGEAGRQVAAPGPGVPQVPEPASLLLLGSGLAGLGFWARRRQN